MSQRDLSTAYGTVAVDRHIAAPPERVWQVVGSAEGMQRWLGLHHFQPRPGGRVLLDTSGKNEADRIIVFGRVSRFEAPHTLAFTWAQLTRDRTVWPVDTQVEVSLAEQGAGTLARLTHSGFDKLESSLMQSAYSVYHHCWVEGSYLANLEKLSEGEA